jgi:hypothetical protein
VGSGLPYIDEHAIVVDSDPASAWDAVAGVMAAGGSQLPTNLVVRALGCREQRADGSSPNVGATLPGWRIVESARPASLVYEGRHRFSRYRLGFGVEPLDGGRSRVTAQTNAAFPGLAGSAYGRLVVGTRVHVVAVRRMLGAIKRRAEGSR